MPKFCARCGTPADADARFCDDCGTPHKPAAMALSTAAPVAAAPLRSRRVSFLAGAGVLAVFAVMGGLAYLTADEAASPEVFAKAINSYYDQNPSASARLRCVADLKLDANPVEVSDYDGRQRTTMDALVAAGLYASPEVRTSGNFFALRSYRYSRTEAGNHAVKDGKLCVAPAISVKSVRLQQTGPGTATKLAAQFHYELKNQEPWLKGDLAGRVTRSLELDEERLAVLEMRNGKWVMTSDDVRVARSVAAGRGIAPPQTLMQRVKSMFRTGNPLLGQWRMTNSFWMSGARISFGKDQASVDHPNEAVHYDVQGDTVTVHYLVRNRSDVFTIQDDDHISLSSDGDIVLLERIKD